MPCYSIKLESFFLIACSINISVSFVFSFCSAIKFASLRTKWRTNIAKPSRNIFSSDEKWSLTKISEISFWVDRLMRTNIISFKNEASFLLISLKVSWLESVKIQVKLTWSQFSLTLLPEQAFYEVSALEMSPNFWHLLFSSQSWAGIYPSMSIEYT